MKIKLYNQTFENVLPYLKLAAQVVNVPGAVAVTVRHGRRGSYRLRSWCYWSSRRVVLILPRREDFQPREHNTLGYFPQHGIALRRPYSVNSWEENLMRNAGHEFGHLMPAGNRRRKSVIELFAETKAAEAIDLLRSEAGQAFIAAQIAAPVARFRARAAKLKERRAYAESIDGQRAKLLASAKRWTAKAKRAATALKKINRRLRALDRRAALCMLQGQAKPS